MRSGQFSALVAILVFAAAVSATLAEENPASSPSPSELFDQRILPIFRSPQPSSCVQCHLAAVDLKNYILPSQEKTFVSLRDQGLIDLDQPEESKILTLIRMGEQDVDDGARLIHAKMRQAEYEAFAAWIRASCSDPKMRALPVLSDAERAGPKRPDEVIRHARRSRVVDSFARNVWSQRMRCFPCHTPHEIDPENPKHQAAVKTMQKFAQELPAETVERLRIFKETPQATLQYLIERSRQTGAGQLPLINLEQPARSLIVLKPTSKLPEKREDGTFAEPSSVEPVSHLGGLKMHPDDPSYKSFVAWIQDYARVVGDGYASVADLPADNWYASKQVLKLTQAPDAWAEGTPVQLVLHSWNEPDAKWSTEPVAFTQGTVTPMRVVNGALFLLSRGTSAPAEALDPENVLLPGGRYLVKVYVDTQHRLATDPALLLGNEDLCGEVVLDKPRWREGFPQAATISAKSLTQE